MKKKVKKKHRFRSILVILLFIYLIVMIFYYVLNLPIKNIYITGNNYIKDITIIDEAGLKKYPPIIKINSKKITKKLKKLELVEDVKVKKNLFGKVTISIKEAKPLFYYRSENIIYLSNGKTVADNNKYLGIPYLVNYTPNDILKEFIKKSNYIDYSIIKMIDEIEYNPDKKDDTVIDETRFLLRMNDGNTVYVNTINLKRLNEYAKVCATIDGMKGVLYLNSNRENISFTSYDTLQSQIEKENEETNENQLQ